MWIFTEDGNFGYLALELCESNLEEYIKNRKELPCDHPPDWKLAKQVLTGLKILHQQNPPILHRDIKPQNVLIGKLQKKKKLALCIYVCTIYSKRCLVLKTCLGSNTI